MSSYFDYVRIRNFLQVRSAAAIVHHFACSPSRCNFVLQPMGQFIRMLGRGNQ